MRRAPLPVADRRPAALAAVAVALLLGCAPPSPPCPAGEERGQDGACADAARRHEPAARLDADNVVEFGPAVEVLRLPEPPRSGFRLVVPPQTLQPGQERLYCVSWPYPALTNKIIYAGRVYTTRGLHHSNVFARPVDPARGPNPYPGCHPGAADPFRDLPQIIPDVLFGNSTQVEGQESLVFPAGMGFTVDTTREIVSNFHVLNATAEPLRVEVVYDFFTMPREALREEVAPFQMSINQFRVDPGERKEIAAECDVFGGKLVSLMMHTHRLATGTGVAQRREGAPEQALYRGGAYDTGSDIKVFDPPLPLLPYDRLRLSCEFENTLGKVVRYGLGDNEMCVLFGYVSPPERQLIAFSDDEDKPCRSFEIGAFRK